MTNPFNLKDSAFMGTDEYAGLMNELNAMTGGADYNTYIQGVNDVEQMKQIAALQGKVYDSAYQYQNSQSPFSKIPFLSGLMKNETTGYNPYYASAPAIGYYNGKPVYNVNQYTDPMLHFGNYELWNLPDNYKLSHLNGRLIDVPMPEEENDLMRDITKALTIGLTAYVTGGVGSALGLGAAGAAALGGGVSNSLATFGNSGGTANASDLLKSAGVGAAAGYLGSQASGLIGHALSDYGASQAYNPSLGNLVLNGAQEYGSNLGSVFYGSAETPFIGAATSAFPTLAEQLGNVFYGTAATPLVTNGLMGNEGTDVNSIIKQALKVGSKALGGGEAPAVVGGATGGGMMSYTPSARQTGNTWATPAIQQENQSFNPSMVAANQANNLRALRNNLIQGNDDTRQDYLKSYIENIDKTDFLKNFYA